MQITNKAKQAPNTNTPESSGDSASGSCVFIMATITESTKELEGCRDCSALSEHSDS